MPDAIRNEDPTEATEPTENFTDRSAVSHRWPRPFSIADTLAKTNRGEQIDFDNCILLLAVAGALGIVSGILLRIWRSHV